MANLKRSGRLFRVLGDALIIILFSLFQTSFIAALPWPFDYFNLTLSILIFVAVILSYRQALWFALFSGLILDLFSSLYFGTLTASLLLTAIILDALFKNFFTNRSFYSLVILGLIGNAIYNLFLLIANFVFFIFGAGNNLFKFASRDNLLGLGAEIIFSVSFLAVMFLAFNFLSKRLKSVFIDAG